MPKDQSAPQHNFTFGALLTPQELREQFVGLKQTPTMHGYAVMTTLPDVVVRQLESGLLPQSVQLGIARSPRGLVAAVLTIQAAGLQVRYIVPLVTPKSKAWLVASGDGRQPFLCALDIRETNQLAVVQVQNALAGDPKREWPMVKAMLPELTASMDVLAQAAELRALALSLNDDRETLLEAFTVDVMWLVLVAEFESTPSSEAPASPPTGPLH